MATTPYVDKGGEELTERKKAGEIGKVAPQAHGRYVFFTEG